MCQIKLSKIFKQERKLIRKLTTRHLEIKTCHMICLYSRQHKQISARPSGAVIIIVIMKYIQAHQDSYWGLKSLCDARAVPRSTAGKTWTTFLHGLRLTFNHYSFSASCRHFLVKYNFGKKYNTCY